MDVSHAMLSIAREEVPEASYGVADMATLDEGRLYDVVVAWDSLFHMPYGSHRKALSHLCDLVAPSGMMLFTAGGVDGEIQGDMFDQAFYYSSLDEVSYLQVPRSVGLRCMLMERDQYPEEHVVFIAEKAST